MRVRTLSLAKLSVCLFLALALFLGPVAGNPILTNAQDAEEPAAPTEEAVPVEPPAAEASEDVPTETEIEPVDEPTEEPVDVPDETEVAPVESVEDEATPEPPAEAPPANIPLLSYEPAEAPNCLPASGDASEPIAAGGTLDYDCAYTLALSGEYVDPSTIALGWDIAVAADSGWSAQLRDTAGNSDWTEADLASATLHLDTSYTGDMSIGVLESLQDVATVHFGLRLERPVCSADVPSIALDVTGSASIPGSADAVLQTTTAQPLRSVIAPALLDIDTQLPSVTILDVAIDPVAFSLTDTQTTGTLTLQVDNPILQCQSSMVSVEVGFGNDSDAAESTALAWVGDLDESTIPSAAADTSGVGAALDTFVVVSSVPDRAETGSFQQTIQFELTIPAAVAAGSYQLSVSAVIEPAE